MSDVGEAGLTGDRVPEESPLAFSDALRVRLAAMSIRLTPLWAQGVHLAQWLEMDAFPAARAAALEELRFAIEGDGSLKLLSRYADEIPNTPEDFRRVGQFLASCSLNRLVVHARLESNQISDLITLVYAARRRLRRGTGRPGSICGRLVSESGVNFACTQTRIHGGTLEIRYSYCVTSFSRMLRRFVRSRRRYADHRALFVAAPRWGLVLAAIAGVPFFAWWGGAVWWLLAALTAVSAAAAFALVYVLLMTIGSVEYDFEEAGHRLSRANAQLSRVNRHIQDDLRRARVFQEKLLPDADRMPLADRLEWAWSFEPATEVGGDYFDVIALGPDRAAVLFADVSGHGLAAALVTAILKTVFQAWADDQAELAELIERLNGNLDRLIPDGSFAAVFAAVYDGAAGRLEYVNAGHHPQPWHIPGAADTPISVLSEGGTMLLGVDATIEANPAQLKIAPGDAVVFVTDGLIEAQNGDGEMFTLDQLTASLGRLRGRAVEPLVRAIVQEVADFAAGAEPGDDRTVLAFQVRQGPGPSA